MSGTFLLAPGQRIDLFVDVTAAPGETAHLVRIDDEEGFSQVSFPVEATPTSIAAREAPLPLPPNPDMKVPDVGKARLFQLNMEGGAMGRLQSATYNGETKSFRELVAENQFWSFNGLLQSQGS